MAKSQNTPPVPAPPQICVFIDFERGLTVFRGPVFLSVFLCVCLFFCGLGCSGIWPYSPFKGTLLITGGDGYCLLNLPVCLHKVYVAASRLQGKCSRTMLAGKVQTAL